jgi:RimJ/RimL family protein N-acetyltransferase
MGGTDPLGCAPLVLDALAHTGLALDVTVVATPATAEALAARARSWPRGRLEVTPPISDLPAAMAQADLVVSAAGTSVWELCALARPMAVVAVVDNQLPGYAALLRAGAAAGLGRPDDLADPSAVAGVLRPLLQEPARRDELATAARTLIDGLGAWRVVSAWEQVVAGATPDAAPRAVAVRPATLDDAELLWRWRNDPATRRSSRVHDPVPLDAHLAWLRGSLERDDRHLLVGEQGTGEQGTVEVGTVRWDREHPGEWEVSITVAPDHRGRGLAGPLLGAGEDWLSGSLPSTGPLEGASQGGDGVAAYLAAVHVDNAASRTLFLHAGYLPDLPPDDAGFERFVKWARPGPT